LQKQELGFSLDQESSRRLIQLTGCPHITLSMYRYAFTRDSNGFLVVRILLVLTLYFYHGGQFKWWRSNQGCDVSLTVCPVCHCEAECNLELFGEQVHVQLTRYKDLGPATERCHPRWISLLKGKGIPARQYKMPSVYTRVRRTARELGCANLRVITYESWQEEVDAATLELGK
jgi:hypothetical protein